MNIYLLSYQASFHEIQVWFVLYISKQIITTIMMWCMIGRRMLKSPEDVLLPMQLLRVWQSNVSNITC